MSFPDVVNVLKKKEPTIFVLSVVKRLMTFNTIRAGIAHDEQDVTENDFARFKELEMELERSLT